MKIFSRLLFVLWLLSAFGTAMAEDTCMATPTGDPTVVTSRFGVWRGGHVHAGLDFRARGAKPLLASSEGKVVFAGTMQGYGNSIVIKRPNGDLISYHHMSAFAEKFNKNGVGKEVKAGEALGFSGISGLEEYGSKAQEHLHFNYGTSDNGGYGGMGQTSGGNFPSDKVANVSKSHPTSTSELKNKVFLGNVGKLFTDPAPYFCDDYPIQDGGKLQDYGYGTTIKQQHEAVYGNIATGGKPPEITAAAMDADAKAEAQAQKQAEAAARGDVFVLDKSYGDGLPYGMMPQSVIGDWLSQSPLAMMLTEARRRFDSWLWQTSLNFMSTSALYIEYLKILAVENYMEEVAQRKRERIQMLLALYILQKTAQKENDPLARAAQNTHTRRLANGG